MIERFQRTCQKTAVSMGNAIGRVTFVSLRQEEITVSEPLDVSTAPLRKLNGMLYSPLESVYILHHKMLLY